MLQGIELDTVFSINTILFVSAGRSKSATLCYYHVVMNKCTALMLSVVFFITVQTIKLVLLMFLDQLYGNVGTYFFKLM